MVSITYGITKEIYSLGTESRVSYGVAAYADAEKDGTATIVASVHDITSDIRGLLKLISECNSLAVSPIHLENIIEDYLAS